jgi:hypothetical protein
MQVFPREWANLTNLFGNPVEMWPVLKIPLKRTFGNPLEMWPMLKVLTNIVSD